MQGQLGTGDTGDSSEGEATQVHYGHQAIQAQCHHGLCIERKFEGLRVVNQAPINEKRKEKRHETV